MRKLKTILVESDILIKISVTLLTVVTLNFLLITTIGFEAIGYTLFLAFNLLVFLLSTMVVYIWAIRPFIKQQLAVGNQLHHYKQAIDHNSIVATTDPNGAITDVNDLFCKISGYSRDELIGQNHRIINCANQEKTFWKQLYRKLAMGEVWQGEFLNKDKDGRLYWLDTTIIPFLNQSGNPEKYISISTDISKAKNVENELLMKNEVLSNNNRQLEMMQDDLEQAMEKLTQKTIDLESEITRRQYAQSQLKQMALNDALTGLPNRRLLSSQAEKLLAGAKRYEYLVGVVFIDLDGFKAINDNHGHKVGDAVLVAIALRLKEQVREIDVVSRLGGDEFVVLLPNCHSVEDIDTVVNRILNALARPLDSIDIPEKLSSSIGVSIYPQDSEDWNELLVQADQAMYQSKKAGKNRITYFERGN